MTRNVRLITGTPRGPALKTRQHTRTFDKHAHPKENFAPRRFVEYIAKLPVAKLTLMRITAKGTCAFLSGAGEGARLGTLGSPHRRRCRMFWRPIIRRLYGAQSWTWRNTNGHMPFGCGSSKKTWPTSVDKVPPPY